MNDTTPNEEDVQLIEDLIEEVSILFYDGKSDDQTRAEIYNLVKTSVGIYSQMFNNKEAK